MYSAWPQEAQSSTVGLVVFNYCLCFNQKYRTHEDLEEKSHKQDRQIESLLNQFDKMRTDQKIKEWMDRAQPDGIHTKTQGELHFPLC
jgi:hypothetical protein